jgi:putative SOS response-associated peptidase YedK
LKVEEWLADLLLPFPAEALGVHPATSAVGSVKHDSPQCIEPLASAQRSLF